MFSKLSVFRIIAVPLTAWAFASCKNAGEIPFPSNDTPFPQPISQSIQFDTPKKIDWPGKLTSFKPVEKRIHFDKFPQRRFDTAGFHRFLKPPDRSPLRFNTLRDTIFNYEALPSIPLRFEIAVLPQPKIIKAGKPYLKQVKIGQVFSFGEPLAGTRIEGFLQASDGLVWIANDKGLYRYDGENYLQFTLPGNSANPLAIYSITEDKKGQLWIGTQSNGVFVLDIKAGISRHLTVARGLLSNGCPRILTDDSDRVWINCVPTNFNPENESSTMTGGGVVIIDLAGNTLKQFTTGNGLSRNACSGITRDDNGNIWIATLHGALNIINTKERKIKWLGVEDGLSTKLVTDLFQDHKGRIWASGWFGDINLIDIRKDSITHLGRNQGLPAIFMSTIVIDHKGNTWIGCFNQVVIINAELSGIKIIDPGNGLNGTNNNALLRDDFNNIWVATTDGPNIIGNNEFAPQYIDTKDISVMSEDNQGRIWIGYLTNDGIHLLDTSSGLVKSITTKEGLADNAVQNIINEEEKVWIISLTKGLDIIDTRLRTLWHAGTESGLRSNALLFCTKDGRGNIWIGMNNTAGADKINLQNKTVYHLGAEQGFSDSSIIDIKEDKSGAIWFSSYVKGIGLIDTVHKTIKHIVNIPALEGGRNNNSMLLLPDNRGNTWIASDRGLVMVNHSKDSFLLFTTREGLSNNTIFSLNENKGNVYVGTANGLNILTPPYLSASKKWEIISRNNSDGIEKNAGSYASDLITKKGDYWWGDKGITIIPNLNNLVKGSPPLPVTITGFDILGKAQQFQEKAWSALTENDTLWSSAKDTFYMGGRLPANAWTDGIKWDSVKPPYNLPVNLQLPYDKNYLQFHYAQVQPGGKDTSAYRYILEGIDKRWSEITKNTSTENYLNLPPGDYAFKVAAFQNSRWTEPSVFRFTITPPWWKTWWAYAFYAIVFFSIVWSFTKYRSRWLKRENQRLEEMVAQRTEELRKSINDLRDTQSQLIQSEKMASLGELTAGIAHEIQNPLNFVNNFSEVNTELANELKDEINTTGIPQDKKAEITGIINDMVQNQEKINFHGKRADAIVKGMLLHSRGSSRQKEPTDINALADEYLRLSYHGLRAKDKSFNAGVSTDFDSSLPLINVVPQDIGRVLLNLLNNAFYTVMEKKKQSPEGYKPDVLLSTKRMGNKIEIAVKDNGNGIPQDIVDKIFQPFFTTKPSGQGTGLGLSLSYDIITKGHGGELKVTTKEGDGSEFIICLPAHAG